MTERGRGHGIRHGGHRIGHPSNMLWVCLDCGLRHYGGGRIQFYRTPCTGGSDG